MSHHKLVPWISGALALSALGVMVSAESGAVPAAWAEAGLLTVLLWVLLAVLSALTPVALPRGQGRVTLAPVVDLGVLFAFGPAAAIWIVGSGRLLAGAIGGPRRLWPALAEPARGILAIWAAGLVFSGGVESLFGATATPSAWGDAALAGLIYAGLDAWLLFGAVRMRAPLGSVARDPRNLAWIASGRAILFPFAVLLAATQASVGSAGVVLFLLPIGMAGYLYRIWLDTRRRHMQALRILMDAVDAGDPFTRGQSQRVARMCVLVGKHLGMPARELDSLEAAALMHDLGRTAVRREILDKPGRLSADEVASVREHPRIATQLIEQFALEDHVAEIVLSHHEQPDGQGYPRALQGQAIPLGSRIIMAVAAFDAMTSDRPYRRGLPAQAAFDELLSRTGEQFFPEIVEALIDVYSSGELTAELLDTVAETAPDDLVPILHLSEGDVVESAVRATYEYPVLPQDGWLRVAAHSDEGCRREHNEDAFGVYGGTNEAEGALLVIADGMGGAAAGEVASRLAVGSVREHYLNDADEPLWAIKRAIKAANQDVRSKAGEDASLTGMGTTCTALALRHGRIVVGHVGDSRCYLIREGAIRRLTRDHTVAEEFAKVSGQTPSAEMSHVLTRCLGNAERLEVDVTEEFPVQRGDHLLLCSDGLSNMVSDAEMQTAVEKNTPAEACRRLVAKARERGGPDNITVLVAHVDRRR